MNDNLTVKPLTPGEKIYWILEQKGMIHFVTVAEIETLNLPETNAWRQALAIVQAKHASLNCCIKGSSSQTAYFAEYRGSPIPLEIRKMSPNGRWNDDAESELTRPFDLTKAPLARVTILERAGGCAILLTVNHSIGDGLSAAFLLRELVSTVASLTTAPNKVSVKMPAQQFRMVSRTRFENAPPISIRQTNLGNALTKELIVRTKENGTTVHSAITAAVVMAIAQLSPEWCGDQLGVLHPISYRRLMSKGERFEMLAGMKICQYPLKGGQSFWELAETVGDSLKFVRTPDTIASEYEALQNLFSSNPDTDFLYQTLDSMTRHQVLISNLGVITTDELFGDLRLKAIYGPMVLPDHPNVQSLGVNTLNDNLTMTLTSRWPVHGLLEKVKDILQQM